MMDSYRVRLLDKFQQPLEAYLEEMKKEDIATLKSIGLTWNWLGFWSQADVNCEAIIKLHYQNNILGVIHFAVYPYPFLNGSPEYLEILHIECVPKHRRIGNPVGLWLIWYATITGLQVCSEESNEKLITLDSSEDAITYYRDIVSMEEVGWTTICQGEDGYAFKFSREKAKEFNTRIRKKHGNPIRI